jgi:hypothetical protein
MHGSSSCSALAQTGVTSALMRLLLLLLPKCFWFAAPPADGWQWR